MKKIMVLFDFPGATTKQYDDAWTDITAAGHEHPKGLLSHAGAPTPNGDLMVVDVWESEQHFKDFGTVLMPIIQKIGLGDVKPTILPVHKFLVQEHMEEMV